MSKCREAFESEFPAAKECRAAHGHGYNINIIHRMWGCWQAAWNARGKVDSAIVKTYDYARFANECAEAIEREDEK